MSEYINNLETGHIELHFEKSEYIALTAEQKTELKGAFNWSRYASAWVSKSTKNHYWALQVAAKLGFTEEEKQGERLSYAEEIERKVEKAEHRAERMEQHAENAEKRGDQMTAPLDAMRGDTAFFTQPNINSGGGRAFTNYRNRLYARAHKGFEEYRKSEYFKERAETAKGTASMAQFNNPVYVDNRIKECQKEMRDIENIIARYEDNLFRIENGEELKNYHGEIITVERLQSGLKQYIEKLEYQIDKQAYLENAMDAIRAAGRTIYTKDDIKPGYLVKIRGSWDKVLSAGPKNVNAASQYSPWGITYTYAEIQDLKIPEDWTDPTKFENPFTPGDIVTRDYTSGNGIAAAFEIVSTTAKTVSIRKIKVVDNKPISGAYESDKAERKTIKRKSDGIFVVNDDRWYLYRYNTK